MFRIRQEHLGQFENNRKEQSIKEIAWELEQSHPQIRSQFPGNQWHEKIALLVQKCLNFGLNTKGTAVKFIELIFIWGENFEEKDPYKWAVKILHNKHLNAEDKFFCLLNTFHAKPTPYEHNDFFTITDIL